jgi:hypothetical protein
MNAREIWRAALQGASLAAIGILIAVWFLLVLGGDATWGSGV